MRWALEAGRRNSRSAKRITYFARSKIVVATSPADAKTSVMSLLRSAAGGVIGLVEEGAITEICVRSVVSIWL